jgi:hypothetical protein
MRAASQLQKHIPFAKGSFRDIFESPLIGVNRASLPDARWTGARYAEVR